MPTGCEPIRLALIGAGRMGRVHLRAIRDCPAVRLTGVVDPREAVRRELAAAGVPTYPDLAQLLAETRPDAALIAAPSPHHLELVGECAAAGLAVFCEKPLGLTTTHADAALRLAADAGVLMQVGYWRRHVASLAALRERIASGALGTILQIACHQWDTEPPSAAFRADSGGISIDMGVHEFDQARWLLGQEIEWVTATAAGPADPRATDPADPDGATMLAGLSGGTALVVSLGRHFPDADTCWVEVWGTQGHEQVAFLDGATGDATLHAALCRQLEAFAAAVHGQVSGGARGDDALAALAVAEAAATALADPSAAGRVLPRRDIQSQA